MPNVHELLGRSAKVTKLSLKLQELGWDSTAVRKMSEDDWSMVAILAGCNPPNSQETKDAVAEALAGNEKPTQRVEAPKRYIDKDGVAYIAVPIDQRTTFNWHLELRDWVRRENPILRLVESVKPFKVRASCGHIVIRKMREATAGVPYTEDTVLDAPRGRACEDCEAKR